VSNDEKVVLRIKLLGKALGTEVRVRLLRQLADSGTWPSITELAQATKTPLSLAAHHVQLLRTYGLVDVLAIGREKEVALRSEWVGAMVKLFAAVESMEESS